DGTTGRNIAIVLYDVTVDNDPGNTADFQNDASLTQYAAGEGAADLIGTLTDSAVLTMHRIDLELEKFVSDPNPELGDTVTWTVIVSNNGDHATTDATGVIVNDVYPAGQSVVASSSSVPVGDTFSEATGVWTLGSPLAPGDSATLTFDTVVDFGVEHVSEFIDLELNTSVDNPDAEEGETVNVEITLTNNAEGSTTNATGVIIRDIIPSGLTYVSDSSTLGSYNSLTRQWNLSSFSLSPGQTVTLNVETTVAGSTAGSTLVVSPEVAQADQTDVDSTPNNTSTAEDDDSQSSINIGAAAGLRNITGQAFFDENNDGIIDVSEVGVNNIAVAVFDSDNNLVGATSTDFLGFYTVTGVPDEDLRLEFFNINTDTTITTAQAPPADSDTVSSVAFIPASSTNAVANLALYRPRDDAELVTTCFVYSETGTDLLGEAAIVAFNADGTEKETLATYGDVGTTYGVAHNTDNGDIFVGAFHRRHTIMGPDGNDAIYRVDDNGNISTFIELDDFFGAGAAGPLSHDITNYFIDAPAFAPTTKVSLADVEISDDNEVIYTVNLFDRLLYAIPVGDPATPTDTVDYAPGDTRTITTYNIIGDHETNPTNGGIPLEQLGLNPTQNIRPFALQERDGLIYVGMVNSAQYNDAGVENVTTPADLHAYVYTLDPTTGQFSDQPVVDFSLDYDRDFKHTTQTDSNWHPWLDDFTYFTFPVDTNRPIYETQPILSDIEFDTNGDMILGFRDRSADQMGIQSPELDGNGVYTADVIAFSGGDIIRAERVGDAQWTVEHHVSAGDDVDAEFYDGE
ncbi:MAG: SdrD B-like domain-containing protein, partial [Planctomycetota bacterium]